MNRGDLVETPKNKVTVEIYGETYPLKSEADLGRIVQVAVFLDERMKETASHNRRLPTTKVAVLTALNIADEFLRLQEDYRKLVALTNRGKG